jgi:hypothetical protein
VRRVVGTIAPSLADGRIDLHVKRAEGEEVHWSGVALLDEHSKPIDAWRRAVAFVHWRETIRRSTPSDIEQLRESLTGQAPERVEAPRIAVLEFWDGGASRTVFVEPNDEVIICRRYEG